MSTIQSISPGLALENRTAMTPPGSPAGENHELLFHESAPALRVLFTEDTFDIIARLVHESDGGPASVARLARTARELHTTAIRILWHTMDSIVPLLKTIPHVKWRQYKIRGGEFPKHGGLDSWGLDEHQSRAINAIDMSSFDKYSSYIREFTWRGKDTVPGTLNDMAAMLSLDRPWLPLLHSFTDRTRSFELPLGVFAGPTLQRLYIPLHRLKLEWLIMLFWKLPSLFPALRELRLQHLPLFLNTSVDLLEDEEYDDAFSDFLWCTVAGAGAPNLRIVSIDEPISWEDVVALASLPCLIQANFRMKQQAWTNFDLTRDISGAFPSIRKLRIIAVLCDSDPILRLFDNIASEDLTHIDIMTDPDADSPGVAAVGRLLKSIAEGPSRNSIVAINLDIPSSFLFEETIQDRAPIEMCTLRPLLSLPNVKILHIRFPWIDLTKNDLCVIASTWPRIRELVMIQTIYRSPYAVDVEWLAVIAEQCRELEIVGLDVRGGTNLSPRIPALLAHASHIATQESGKAGSLCNTMHGWSEDAGDDSASHELSRCFAETYLQSLFDEVQVITYVETF